ncbi:MAG TPA: NepR family anti-sigma factor [Hyphomicrobiaceae bacterium]|nr:NepR family anti-sigma factor [Hyphomicrobiaceae bacterium]
MGTNRERQKISAKGGGDAEFAATVEEIGQRDNSGAASPSAANEADPNFINDDEPEDKFESALETCQDAADPGRKLDPQVRAHLGRLVRSSYAALVEEPVPERFLTLLEELERQERRN